MFGPTLNTVYKPGRRKRGDMIQVWKILHGQDHVDKNKWFSSAYLPRENERPTRMSSDPLNLFPVGHTEIRRNIFSARIINIPLQKQAR